MATDTATRDDLQAVEQRLDKRIDRLEDKIDARSSELMKAISELRVDLTSTRMTTKWMSGLISVVTSAVVIAIAEHFVK